MNRRRRIRKPVEDLQPSYEDEAPQEEHELSDSEIFWQEQLAERAEESQGEARWDLGDV